nr:glycogen debranching enzyme N-terminal domain-containing protein [Verrucomicrobiota bacterium]
MNPIDPSAEWIETDGLGGFASGTVSGIRTRRYHALLLTATTPPAGRIVLVNGCDVWLTTAHGRFALSSQRYTPDVIDPDGSSRIQSFEYEPWPRWRFQIAENVFVEQELLVRPGQSAVYLSWRIDGETDAKLEVRPFFSGRDFHSMHQENDAFRFEAEEKGERVSWHPYENLPTVSTHSNGHYLREQSWYRNFFYSEEESRGLDASEDLAVPGVFEFDLSKKPAVLMFAADGPEVDSVETIYAEVRASELQRRSRFPTPVH